VPGHDRVIAEPLCVKRTTCFWVSFAFVLSLSKQIIDFNTNFGKKKKKKKKKKWMSGGRRGAGRKAFHTNLGWLRWIAWLWDKPAATLEWQAATSTIADHSTTATPLCRKRLGVSTFPMFVPKPILAKRSSSV
jgi:hypothetical protein